MEENENRRQISHNLDSFSMKISSHAAVLSSDPLFSSFATLYTLILLYFPRLFFKIIFSPVLLITSTLLLTLLRFGATQRNHESRANCDSNCTPEPTVIAAGSDYFDQDHQWVAFINTNFEESFLQWNVRAPLEVIYEAFEGEEDDEEEEEEENAKDPNNENDPGNKDPFLFSIERYPSLSLYYPETDSDASSDGDFSAIGDWGSPESVCYRWEDEDREGLIEIALDRGHVAGANGNNNKSESLDFENFHGEEENNLIEIDISPAKNEEKRRFSGES